MTRHPITLISFGYLHTPRPPRAERVDDLRESLRDPARAKGILDLTGLNRKVQAVVLFTPGALDLLADIVIDAGSMRPDAPRRIAIGCAGGRHRSVALVELAAAALRDEFGVEVVVQHLHVHLPRVLKPAERSSR